MADGERLRRSTPERTGPRRSFAEQLFPPAAAPRLDPAPAASQSAPTAESEGAAQLGYQVIDDYLEQGRRAAERLSGSFLGAGMFGPFQTSSERLIRDGLHWLELLSRMWTNVLPRAEAEPVRATSLPVEICVRIASSRPAEVLLQLAPGAAGRRLGVHPLHSPDSGAAVLDQVQLAPAEGGAGWRVGVQIPSGQPAGQYSGVVYDLADGAVRGTLVVRLEAQSCG